MTARLVTPDAAAARLAARLTNNWPALVCDELRDGARPLEVALAPGVTRESHLAQLGFDARHAWTTSWAALRPVEDAPWRVRRRPVVVQQVAEELPATLVVDGVGGALAFLARVGVDGPGEQVERARSVASRIAACRGRLTPATLRGVCRLADDDVDAMTGALRWLDEHPDVSGWTLRQLPIPGIHSKWLERHGTLLRDLTGRDVRREARPRLAVVHLSYVDPGYLATGRRRHDAWTAGDVHDLAYPPTTVLVVENRDCRLWFPPVDGAVVVEGGGKAAATLLADLPWLHRSRTVVYWGDLDADGFTILDRFRAAMSRRRDDGSPSSAVHSLLMDARTLARYEHLGVARDRDGSPIASSSTVLPELTDEETAAYYAVATRGPVAVRRVEQERIPLDHARTALLELLRQVREDEAPESGGLRGAVG